MISLIELNRVTQESRNVYNITSREIVLLFPENQLCPREIDLLFPENQISSHSELLK